MPGVGVIGTGRIGSMLVRGLIKNRTFSPGEIVVQNRTLDKAKNLSLEIPGIEILTTPEEVIKKSEIIFLNVKPQDFPSLLSEIGHSIPKDKLLVSTMLAPPLSRLEEIIEGPVTRVYPSVVQDTGRGVSLVAFGREVTVNQRENLFKILNDLGMVFEVPESQFRVCGDITSCGPAFMSYMIGALARVAVQKGVDKKMAYDMALETMQATASWLEENQLTFEDLVERVATPGGCTGEGVKVLEESLDESVHKVFSATSRREKEIDSLLEL